MCGRYTLSDPGDLMETLEIEDPGPIEARYNIAPTQNVPVVRASDDGRELAHLRWGLIPFWADDPSIGNRMINARSETVAEKASFKHALKRRRCAIPADGFYEWKKMGGGKQPFHIHLPGLEPFVFAGLWERWTKGDEPVESCTIITADANDTIRDLHNRMPVILPEDALGLWLDPSVEDPEAVTRVLGPWQGEELEFFPVSRVVNSPANDRPECIEKIEL